MDTEDELGERLVTGVHAYCFYEDKLLVVFSEEKKFGHQQLEGSKR